MIIVAGPCQIESVKHCLLMADQIDGVSSLLGRPIIFKASFDKANRTSATSPRGVGLDRAMEAFTEIRTKFPFMKLLTDVHEPRQCERAAQVVDIIQVPALLSRQTDLIQEAASTGKTVNIKKGQFMAPEDMAHAVDKARRAGAETVWVTERGTSFGYHDIVADMRAIRILHGVGADAVLFDCSHSAQKPASHGDRSGGDRRMVETLARSAIAAGADGIYTESHNDPDHAMSDGETSVPADSLYDFLKQLDRLHNFVAGLDS